EHDKGQADALNKGFGLSTGEVMGWLNSDDMLMPGALERVGRIFQVRSDFSWVTGRIVNINKHDQITNSRKPPITSRIRFLAGDYMWIQQESTFWRRRLWEMSGAYIDDSVKLAVDGELWLRFFQ